MKSIAIDLQGTISQRCALGEIPGLALGNLETAARSYVTHVSLDCNVPIEVRVVSVNGGLKNREYPAGQGPYSGSLPYEFSLTIPTRSPQQGVVSQRFSSADLIATRSMTSNGGIAIDGMELRLELGRPTGEAGLLGGDYQEIIEITIVPI